MEAIRLTIWLNNIPILMLIKCRGKNLFPILKKE